MDASIPLSPINDPIGSLSGKSFGDKRKLSVLFLAITISFIITPICLIGSKFYKGNYVLFYMKIYLKYEKNLL